MRSNTAENWDSYWNAGNSADLSERIYAKIAKFYRNELIGPRFSKILDDNFETGAEILHAGCGAGEVDFFVPKKLNVSAIDISEEAVKQYKLLHPNADVFEMDIFSLPSNLKTFDGIYNLGVMEHFSNDEVDRILTGFNKSLKSNGKIVLFWPPVFGLSVIGLHLIHFVLRFIKRKKFRPLHPDEPNKLTTKNRIQKQLSANGFELEKFSFSMRDGFTYVVLVARKA